jgi:predicted SnoaL-like aldol condensation-catalyzing enzyme
MADAQPLSSPRSVVDGLLQAIVAGDDEAIARISDLSPDELSSLRTRHSSIVGALRLEPEFTLVDRDRVTTAVWLPVPLPSGVVDLYSFDSYEVADGRVTSHVTGAVPTLEYAHVRGQTEQRRPLPDDVDQHDVSARRAELVAGFNRDVFEAGNPDAVDRYVTDDYRQHAEWRGPSGRAALKHIVEGIRANPGPADRPPPQPLFVTVQGALVVAAARMGATVAFDAYLIRDGLLAEHWSGIDPRWRP